MPGIAPVHAVRMPSRTNVRCRAWLVLRQPRPSVCHREQTLPQPTDCSNERPSRSLCHDITVATAPITTVSHGTLNGASAHRPFDRWLRYPAGLSGAALDATFEQIGRMRRGGAIIDPFCGVGTVGTAARTHELGFIGIEAHPWIAQVARLKFETPDEPATLRSDAEELVRDLGPSDTHDEHELIRRAFAPEMLGLLVTLRERIRNSKSVWREHLDLALLANLRSHAAVKVGWPYQLPRQPREPRSNDPAALFIRRTGLMAEDLERSDASHSAAQVIHGDSRDPLTWAAADLSVARAAISSPPYLNNFDYADATRLELYFARTVSSWKELVTHVRSGMLVATTQQTTIETARHADEQLAAWPGVHAHVRRIIGSLECERLRRGRGKEYSRVAGPYFAGIGQVLENLAFALPSNAPIALVVGDSAPYGIFIDTPAILLAIGAEVGLIPVGSSVLRTRGSKWRTNGSRHQVPLTEKLVEFRVRPRTRGRGQKKSHQQSA